MARYDAWDEAALEVARGEWEQGLKDANRRYDRAKTVEAITSAREQGDNCREELAEINRALIALRRPPSAPPRVQYGTRSTSPKPKRR
jgi:hypothetical protein